MSQPIDFNSKLSSDDPTLGQSNDGTAHMAYFIDAYQLSFIWDGKNASITVAFGGYGEHPFITIPAPKYGNLDEFKAACDGWFVAEVEEINRAFTEWRLRP